MSVTNSGETGGQSPKETNSITHGSEDGLMTPNNYEIPTDKVAIVSNGEGQIQVGEHRNDWRRIRTAIMSMVYLTGVSILVFAQSSFIVSM